MAPGALSYPVPAHLHREPGRNPMPARHVVRTPSRALQTCVLLVALVAGAPAPAQAYVDPGTGSFVLQGIIAAVVGIGVALKMFWGRIRERFGGRGARPDDRDDDDA
jgi:hypothetical protein